MATGTGHVNVVQQMPSGRDGVLITEDGYLVLKLLFQSFQGCSRPLFLVHDH